MIPRTESSRFRRRRLFVAAICLSVLNSEAAFFATAAAAQEPTFQQQLEGGLKARRPQEFAFIARVVEHVEGKRTPKLPLGLVKAIFQWARSKRPHPFPYFERAIREEGRKIGVGL